jgi:hypothetical protein
MKQGEATEKLLASVWERIQTQVNERLQAGSKLVDLAACVIEHDGRAHFLVDDRAVILRRLREDLDPVPTTAIREVETEPTREGLLRLITLSEADGWATHWTEVGSGAPGGEA